VITMHRIVRTGTDTERRTSAVHVVPTMGRGRLGPSAQAPHDVV
jgi:hypothetical protein